MEADFSQFDHLTDVLGSMPFIKRYSMITLAFENKSSRTISEISTHLEGALHRLAAGLPFLTGKVVYESRDEKRSGIRRIVPHEGKIPLIVKDLTAEYSLSMDEMAKAGFPMTSLEAGVLVPPIAITWASDGYEVLAPVLILQANFVSGGLLLTIASNHSTMDMTGLGMVIAFLSKACRGEGLTEIEIQQANQDRSTAIPLLGPDYKPGDELEDSFINPTAAAISIKPADWSYFTLDPSELTSLKATASQQDIVPYISTDDAISALLWQRIAAVRSKLYSDTYPPTSQLARTVSARSFLGLKGYIGHMVDCTYRTLPDPASLALGTITGHLRAVVLDKEKIVHHIRAFATVLDRVDDKSKLINGAKLDPNWDVIVSSYANIKTCELDFGEVLGGRPLAARRPKMPGWPSLCYTMPADRDGKVAVAVCLPAAEMNALADDAVFSRYAKFVG